jgi:hypothetical protein
MPSETFKEYFGGEFEELKKLLTRQGLYNEPFREVCGSILWGARNTCDNIDELCDQGREAGGRDRCPR